MGIPFQKMHGAGNDFILINNFDLQFHATTEQIAQMCHRQYGIGADGLILIQPSDSYAFRMMYFNADGKEGSMCGNGGRVAAVFAYLNSISGLTTSFEAFDGLHHAEITEISEKSFQVRLTMNDVLLFEEIENAVITDTGSPHLVVFSENVKEINVFEEGRKLRYDARFAAAGINVNFLEKRESDFFIRTYERGVENETLSCGTGITAAAVALNNKYGLEELHIQAVGGDFKVELKKENNRFTNIVLHGPVSLVYSGIWPT